MTLLYVLVIALLVSVALYVASGYLFATLTLNPKRQPVVASPADVGLEHEEIEFLSRDGLRLKGWFLPGDPGRVLVVTHPMYCNRHGVLVRKQSVFMATRTDIDLLPSFRALNQAGYSVLTSDFRNHGASDSGQTGVGLNEYQDVLDINIILIA